MALSKTAETLGSIVMPFEKVEPHVTIKTLEAVDAICSLGIKVSDPGWHDIPAPTFSIEASGLEDTFFDEDSVKDVRVLVPGSQELLMGQRLILKALFPESKFLQFQEADWSGENGSNLFSEEAVARIKTEEDKGNLVIGIVETINGKVSYYSPARLWSVSLPAEK